MNGSIKAGVIAFAIILGGGTYLGIQNRDLFRSEPDEPTEREGPIPGTGDEESTDSDAVTEVSVLPQPSRDYAFEIATDDVMEIADHGQAHVDEVRALWDKAVAWYSIKNTEQQIADAVERIYQARQYYPDLTHKQCLEYIIDHIPDEIRINQAEYTEKTVVEFGPEQTSDEIGSPNAGMITQRIKLEVTSMGVDIHNVRQVAEKVYLALEDSYLEPYRRAQEAAAAQQAAIAEQQAAAAEVIARNAEATRQKQEARRQKYREDQALQAQQQAETQRQLEEWSEEQKRRFYGY